MNNSDWQKYKPVDLLALTSGISNMIYRCRGDESWSFEYVSPGCWELVGYSYDDLVKEHKVSLKEIAHPTDLDAIVHGVKQAHEAHQPCVLTFRILTASGEEKWIWMYEKEVRLEDDLDIYREGILVDVTTQMRAETALWEKEERYRLLFEDSPIGIFHYDSQMRITDCNPRMIEIMRSSNEQLIGLDLNRLLDQAPVPAIRAALVGEEGFYEGEYQTTTSGVSLYLRLRTASLTGVDGTILGAVGLVEDITDRNRVETEQDAMVAIAAVLRTAASRSEVVKVFLEYVTRFIHARGAALYARHPITERWIFELGVGEWLSWTGQGLSTRDQITDRVIASRQAYINSNGGLDGPETTYGLAGTACLPLVVQEQSVGALWVGRRERFTEHEVRLLITAANIAAIAIQRTTLYEEIQRKAERLSILRCIDLAIAENLNLQSILDILIEQITNHLGVDAADVLLLAPKTDSLHYLAGRGFLQTGLAELGMRIDQLGLEAALLEGKRVGVADVRLLTHTPFAQRFPEEGFIAYHAAPLMAKGSMVGILEAFARKPLEPDPEWEDFFETLAGQAAIAIDNAMLFHSLQNSNYELVLAYESTLEGWARALELRDRETEGHAQRVTEMTMRLGQAMHLEEQVLFHMRRGALLHDIGKLGIPDRILLKPGPLTEKEWAVMREHPIYAYKLLYPIPYLRPAIDIPYGHHEKWDGTGYPQGLRGEDIPLPARIFAVIDVWDALTCDRPYRKAWTAEQARAYIQQQSGRHFDPQVVAYFMEMLNSSG